ncbi:hypothetical protein GGR58DRAFT_480561 [Xylaria digitata]|nr:hypothetical protein GGR58DRAFT_480561 [Xylaria digitata]
MSGLPPGADLSTIPLTVNPNGSPPDFDGGPSLQTAVLGTGVVFITVSFTVLLIRLYAVFKTTKRLYAEDYACSVGELFAIAYWVTNYIAHSRAGFRHSWDTPLSELAFISKLDVVEQALSGVAHTLMKCSIILFYIRIFSILRWIRIICYTLLIFTPIFYATYVALGLAYCIPGPGKGWLTSPATCTNISVPATVAAGAVAVLIDIILFVLPFFVVSKLNLSRDKKKALVIVFLIGVLIIASSVADLAFRVIVYLGLDDPIWNATQVTITSYTEMFGTEIVSCAPGLYSFWRASVTQSSAYHSIRSLFLGSSKSYTTTAVHSDGKPHSCPPAEACSFCSHGQDGNHIYASVSSQELVSPPIPLEGITKHTVIRQHSNTESTLEKSQNRSLEMQNTTTEW